MYLPIYMSHHFLRVDIWEFIMNVEISRKCPNQETVLGNRGRLKVLDDTIWILNDLRGSLMLVSIHDKRKKIRKCSFRTHIRFKGFKSIFWEKIINFKQWYTTPINKIIILRIYACRYLSKYVLSLATYCDSWNICIFSVHNKCVRTFANVWYQNKAEYEYDRLTLDPFR